MDSRDFSRLEAVLERMAIALERLKVITSNQQSTMQDGASEPKMSSRTAKLPEAECRKEDDQFIWTIPEGAPEGKCRDCQGTIIWVRSRKGKAVPIDPDGLSHMDSCSARNKSKGPEEGAQDSTGKSEINVPF